MGKETSTAIWMSGDNVCIHFVRTEVKIKNLLLLNVHFIFCSENFATAVSARFLWGFLNGNVGVVKTYLSEVRSVYCIQ